ncbi:MAG: PA14 domain-containing protein, partial [Armatimonadota bacterium]|nr:PA14 domain-containing protein [Armatimonadota bacterium]
MIGYLKSSLLYGIALLLFLSLTGPAQAQTGSMLFQDEFNGSSFNLNAWSVYDNTRRIHRTQFGAQPTIATENGISFARLPLNTYNPSDPGNYLQGTQILSKLLLEQGEGVVLEARVRGRNLPRGIVFAFFTLGERGVWPDTYSRDEIDFEFLTNLNRNQIWLNVWDDQDAFGGGTNRSGAWDAPGIDWSTWTTYKILWLKDRIDWLVNVNGSDMLVRRSTDILPKDPMSVRFNIWAAASDWTTAYDGGLTTTTNQANNASYYLDVDYVRVRSVTAPVGVIGNGTGLTGTYYNNQDFTGTTVTRVDPQIRFNWGEAAPASSIDPDTFSVRWTGQVQAQVSETYTFYTRTDDGARLWINDQLLIDDWNGHPAQENSGTIQLAAGVKYNIKMEYFDGEGGAVAELLWSSPSIFKQAVPQSQLYPTGASAQPPVITTHPASQTKAAGQPVTFSVAATGTAPLSYLWQRNGVNISGATAANYTISSVTTADNGAQFRALVSNSAGQAISNVATLTVTSSQPPVVGNGTGLTGTYYNNQDFTGTTVTRVDPRVQFDWGTASPAPSLDADTFSVRWTGQVQAQVSQLYTFYTRSDDGVRLWVNGQLLVNNWTDHGVEENSGTIQLAAGAKYAIKMEFYEGGGEAVAHLLWSSPTTAKQAVPQSQLYPSAVPPVISQHPVSQTKAAGQSVTFSVTATGTGTLSYQWQRNGVNIPKAIYRNYQIYPVALRDNGARFRVIVSNSVG